MANPEPAPAPTPCSDHPGVVHKKVKVTVPKVTTKKASSPEKTSKPKSTKGSSTSHPWASAHPSKKPVPKVQTPSKDTLNAGAAKAVDQFANHDYIPKKVGTKIAGALQSAIASQLAPKAKPTTLTLKKLKTKTITATSTQVVHNGTQTLTITPSPSVLTVTDVVTTVSTSTFVTGSATAETDIAALNIKAALDSAFRAANLSQSDLDATTVQALEACLQTVLAKGGLPSGYACLTSSGSNSAGLQATLNTILEQFVGILPNIILENLFDAVSPSLTSLLPASEQTLISQIEASIKSVIATLSGSSVTALEQVSSCYTKAIQLQGNTSSLSCFTSGAESTLQTASNAVLESFVGVLPASLVTSVQNIFAYNLANTTGLTGSAKLAAQVQAQISNAINSAASTLSGNTVSAAESLQACATLLIQTGDAKKAQECITKGEAADFTMTTVLGLTEQFQGYLPSSFFTDLVTYATPLLSNTTLNHHNLTSAQIDAAFDSFFNNATSFGPAYTGCIEQIQKCVTNAIEEKGKLAAVCPGPVKGCTSLKKSSSGSRMRRSSKQGHRRSWLH
ncbi:hypothetical protein T439DRAFT_331172 [Meredithblackwellia eburnea MCA 4105]